MGTATGSQAFTTNNAYVSGLATWTETWVDGSNTSTIALSLAYKTSYLNRNMWLGGTVSVDGTVVVSPHYTAPATHYFYATNTAIYYPVVATGSNPAPPWTSASIAHEADGSKTVTIDCVLQYYDTAAHWMASSFNITLATLPRATTPTLSASTADMGTEVTIGLTSAASATFTHDLTYALTGGGTGTIATGIGQTTQAWTVPDFATAVPNAVSGTATITCVTKSDGVTIGSKVLYLTATVPATVLPTISEVTVTEATAGIAAQFSAFIQSKSTLAVEVTAAGASGSTISSYSTVIQGKAYSGASFTSDAVTASGSVTVVTTVTDSRGRTASNTETITVVAYAIPAVTTFSVYRVDEAGGADDSGNYVAVRYAYTVPSLNSGNTASLTIKCKKSTDESYATTLVSGSALTADTTAKPEDELSSDYQWDVQITVTDYFSAASVVTARLTSGAVILDIKADGTGIAFGKTAEIANKVDIAAGWTFPFMGATNPNLLHNWDFRNPVNQRGASGSVTSGYFFDRWTRYAGTLTINAGYLSFAANAAVLQFFEGTGLSGKAVTASVMIGGTVYSATGTYPSSVGDFSDITITGFGVARLGWDANGLLYFAPIADGTARDVQAVKLELGSVSTLAYDPPMDYGTELAKCQRYFLSASAYPWITGYTDSSTEALVEIATPATMRGNPTISHSGITIISHGGAYSGTITGQTVKPCGVRCTITGAGFPVLHAFTGYIASASPVFFSADL